MQKEEMRDIPVWSCYPLLLVLSASSLFCRTSGLGMGVYPIHIDVVTSSLYEFFPVHVVAIKPAVQVKFTSVTHS